MKLLNLKINQLSVNVTLIRPINSDYVIGKLVRKLNGCYSFVRLNSDLVDSSKFITDSGFQFTSIALRNYINNK